MYKIEIVNKKTKEVITYNNVDDKNNGEKLYYKFEIDATTLTDGEYTINVYNDDDVMVCSDTLNVGEFNTNKLQYKRGNNIYISTNLDVTTEDKYVTLTSIELTVKPTDGVDAMTSVTINAQPIFDDAYNSGYENGATDGYDEGVREQKSKLTSIDITKNGTYTTEDGYSNVNVNVQSESYSYKVNTVDEDGLRQLGWDDASIGYFKDNTLHYATQNDEYVVSEENLALKNVIKTGNDLKNNLTNPNLIYAPLFDTSDLKSGENLFKDCKTLKAIPKINLQNWEYCNNMFTGCSALTTIPQLETSKVKNIPYLFSGCTSLTSIPLIETKNVTSMYSLFNNCSSLTSIPLLETKNVTTMAQMFSGCSSLTSIPLLDSKNVSTMERMFYGCSALKTIPQLVTSNVSNMSRIFSDCTSLTSIPLLETKNVNNMSGMFASCSTLKTIPQLNTSNVTTLGDFFYSCPSLTSIPLLDTSNVKDISRFFGYSLVSTLTELGGFKNLKIDWNDTYGLNRLPNLTYQSVMNVINNLYDFRGNGDTSTTRTIKFNSKSLALLSDDDKAIATAKGWVLTS